MIPVQTITREKRIEEGITLKRFVEEKRLLKTQIKLLHILYLDEDIISLNREGLTLSTLDLEDIYLTEEMHVIVPVANKIIAMKENDLKLRTYLIYFSYLYNVNFLKIYENNPQLLWQLISKLQISERIKKNFYELLETNKGAYFSTYLEELNNAEYRSNLREDKLILQRSVNI